LDRVVVPTTEQLIALWPQWEPLLKPLLAKEGHYECVDILAHHSKGEMIVWISWDGTAVEAVMVSQIHRFPRKTVCHVPYIAGKNMRAWKDEFQNKVERHAREVGAKTMHGAFRKGWVRAAGYQLNGVLLKKELT